MYRTVRFSIRGTEIRATISWTLVAIALAGITAWLAVPEYFESQSTTSRSAYMAISILVLVGSLVLHELAHVFAARMCGLQLTALSPQLVGSLPDSLYEAESPAGEIRVGIAGPAMSAALAVAAGTGWWLAEGTARTDVSTVLGLAALANLGLAVVSFMPGYPFDGGRILRGLVWYLGGDLMAATRIVGYVGYVLIMGAMTAGVFLLVEGGVSSVWGVWILVSAYAINRSVGTGISHVFWAETSRRLRVDDVYIGGTRRIQAEVAIDQAIERMLEGHDQGPLLVFDSGIAVGLVDLDGVRPVPRKQWASTAIGDVMRSIDGLPSTSSSSSLSLLISLLPPDQDSVALITRDDAVIGAADRADVVRRLQNYLAAERIEEMRRGR